MDEVSFQATLGIFVGGKGRRMGGANKALLRAPGGDETLAARLLRLGRALALPVVFVGHSELPASLAEVPRTRDSPPGIGPLGGLCGLLAYARTPYVLCVATDMPYVTAALLAKLLAHPARAAVVAARDPALGKWHPLFARYDVAAVAPVLRAALAEGARSPQQLLARLSVEELPLGDQERAALRDWDRPEDLAT